jgi:hypothetical protein
MEVPENDGLAEDSDARFVEQSYLTYMVPSETNINLEEAFKNSEGSGSLLDAIPKRHSLFFGIHLFYLAPSTETC